MVKVSDTSSGKTLVDSKGMTLYFFTKDVPGSGKSSCSGQCAATWPVFSGDVIAVSPPLASSDFSSFARDDGIKQATYKGRPLYYYNADTKLGDTKGQGINNVWFIADVSGTVPAVTIPANTVLTPVITTVLTTQSITTAPTSRGGYGY
jgi:predicted lipoprotein with Yx(FWY)xxD motif